MRNTQIQVLNALDSVTQTGGKVDANQLASASFHVYCTDATGAGSLKIQASNDPCGFGNVAADFTPTNWVDIPSATATQAANGQAIVVIANMSFRWVRAVWTQTAAGSGNVVVNMNAIGV